METSLTESMISSISSSGLPGGFFRKPSSGLRGIPPKRYAAGVYRISRRSLPACHLGWWVLIISSGSSRSDEKAERRKQEPQGGGRRQNPKGDYVEWEHPNHVTPCKGHEYG